MSTLRYQSGKFSVNIHLNKAFFLYNLPTLQRLQNNFYIILRALSSTPALTATTCRQHDAAVAAYARFDYGYGSTALAHPRDCW
jgi:hypothetical protein